MSIDIERDICGDAQQSSFGNATLQSGPPGLEFSIAVHLEVPIIGVYDQDTLAQFIERTFEPISDNPRVQINVQMGREGDGYRWYLEDLEAAEPTFLPRANEEGVEIILEKRPGRMFDSVTLVADNPAAIVRFVRAHWGSDDQQWLAQIEESIEYGEVPCSHQLRSKS